jgi:hypothetical protein
MVSVPAVVRPEDRKRSKVSGVIISVVAVM